VGLLDFLAPAPFDDGVLGTLRRSWLSWRGAIELDRGRPVPLVISGSRSSPASAALDLARHLPQEYPKLKPAIGQALLDHIEPARDLPDEVGLALPPSGDAEAVWRSVTPVHVLIAPVEGTFTVEIGLRADWDEEHTLGALLRDWRLVGLNGSVRGV
jgi:hypothetical protein